MPVNATVLITPEYAKANSDLALSAALGQNATFTIPLGPTADGPITHYGASMNASDAMRTAIARQEMAAPDGSSADWVRYEYKRTAQYNLYVTNSPTAALGTSWSFAKSCEDCGLVQVLNQPMLLEAG